ncbi:MAG: hypothetical protein DRJ62_04170 [Thermoprotei archaeon]|nr:MAG: hypothetical protein DRJ62_04170 [Thermoprotei archaeon]
MKRRSYPHLSDIAEAIYEVLSREFVKPQLFYDKVKLKLEEKGFCTIHVTVKRVWRVYEDMVRRGRIYDVLGVVEDYGGYEDYLG